MNGKHIIHRRRDAREGRALEELAGGLERIEALFADPTRKDIRWQLDIDDDVLSDAIRTCEFRNWLDKVVLPAAGVSEGLGARNSP